MFQRILEVSSMALAFLAAGCVGVEPSIPAADSLIRGRTYGAIVEELKDLASRHADTAQYFKYGESLAHRELALLRIGREDLKPVGKRPAIFISGSIHGNEFLNIEDRLPAWFLAEKDRGGVKKFLDSGGFIYITPIMNPDGYSARRRGNERGVDLNRDFDVKKAHKAGFTQPETRLLASFLEEQVSAHQLEVKLTFDMHCCSGGVIFPWGFSRTMKLPAEAMAEHQRIGQNIIVAHFPEYRFGQAHQVLGYTAVGASDDFYHETFGSVSFTFEGERQREKGKFAQHTRMWDALLADRAGPPAAASAGRAMGTPKVAVSSR